MRHAKKVDPLLERLGVEPADAVETLQQLWTPGQAGTAPALDLGAECIRRLLVPEKVQRVNRHGDGPDLLNRDQFRCPVCKRQLRNTQPDPHCPRCGQLLDWEV